jgi:hypothetical protein
MCRHDVADWDAALPNPALQGEPGSTGSRAPAELILVFAASRRGHAGTEEATTCPQCRTARPTCACPSRRNAARVAGRRPRCRDSPVPSRVHRATSSEYQQPPRSAQPPGPGVRVRRRPPSVGRTRLTVRCSRRPLRGGRGPVQPVCQIEPQAGRTSGHNRFPPRL